MATPYDPFNKVILVGTISDTIYFCNEIVELFDESNCGDSFSGLYYEAIT